MDQRARAHTTRSPGPCVGGERLFGSIAVVLDALAIAYRGAPVQVVTPVLRRAWQAAFDTALPEPSVTRCAQAIAAGAPWVEVLWPDGWHRPHPLPPPRTPHAAPRAPETRS